MRCKRFFYARVFVFITVKKICKGTYTVLSCIDYYPIELTSLFVQKDVHTVPHACAWAMAKISISRFQQLNNYPLLGASVRNTVGDKYSSRGSLCLSVCPSLWPPGVNFDVFIELKRRDYSGSSSKLYDTIPAKFFSLACQRKFILLYFPVVPQFFGHVLSLLFYIC